MHVKIGFCLLSIQPAAGFLERALKTDPNNYSARCLLGNAYKQLGREAEANRELELTRTLRADKEP